MLRAVQWRLFKLPLPKGAWKTQESIGYAFLKEIPKPAVFFLVGSGSNGKSVFVNTISNLFGQENVSTISLNQLTNEYYTLGLFGKMVNISSETPHKKQINTDMVKAAVAGDWISGRNPYKEPTKFKPYAKHFLSMNQIPSKNQNSNIKIKATVSLHSYLII